MPVERLGLLLASVAAILPSGSPRRLRISFLTTRPYTVISLEMDLAKRLTGIPEYRTAYLRALVKAATLPGGTDGWADREITREFAVLHEAAAHDPNKWCLDHACGTAQFVSDVRWLHGFLSERSRIVLAGVAKAGHAADQAP